MIKPEILMEDNHLLVVRKPAGVLTQGDSSGRPVLLDDLKAFIKRRDEKPGNVYLGMVQRLDRPVSGVIVFAKTSKAASRISEQIRKRRVDKVYLAVSEVHKAITLQPNAWQEFSDITKRQHDRTVIADQSCAEGKASVLQVRPLYADTRNSCLMIRLISGRKHQIRAQLAHRGMPVLGDVKYGARMDYKRESIALHAWFCSFDHPVKDERCRIDARMPDDFIKCFPPEGRKLILEACKGELGNLYRV